MKKLIAVTVLLTVAGLMNIGCSASASVRKVDTTRPSSSVQMAYTNAPTK